MIPYGKQSIDEDDINSVIAVLKSDFITQGDVVPEFESAISQYCGAGYSIAVNSATSALHIACLALGVGVRSLVWVPAITFVATANCARYCGADVDFIDIDSESYNIDVNQLEARLATARNTGAALPDVVIAVDMAGNPCDMARIKELSVQYGFSVIEDASHAIGSAYHGHRTGGCQYSDITVFSFHPVKIITTGEGGLALTNNAQLAEKMALLRSHAITRDSAIMEHSSEHPWYYEQLELGFNYRMTDIHAALGRSQLNKLDGFIEQRCSIARYYQAQLTDTALHLPQVTPGCSSSWHLYVVLFEDEPQRDAAFYELRTMGIGVNVHYIPVYFQPYYRRLGFSTGLCPQAEEYYSRAISLPIYPSLAAEDQAYVVESLKEILS